MTEINGALQTLYNDIPRRHTDENMVEIKRIVSATEDLFIAIEAINPFYEKNIPAFFDALEEVNTNIKKANDRKASKKSKDSFMDAAADQLKDTITDCMVFLGNGERVE